ncbi:uncharacterized protein isoform X2 [Musca autumnalis]|uniref:uncharacterized protein isoform X2 n=1 Tax=Musca autumnalis TaxID=221902 RepID=UPI003CFB792E
MAQKMEVMDATMSEPQPDNQNGGALIERDGMMTRSKRALENGVREGVCKKKVEENDMASSYADLQRQNMKKRRFNDEIVLYTEEHKESHKKSNGGKQANPTTIDDDVNAILTPFTYNSVAKKPKKQYVHKPGVQMAKRMFEEPSPKAPVFVKENQKVTELEKVTKELLKFMEDFFKKDNNQVALEAMSHFQQRILKCGVPMDAVEHQQSISQHDGVSQAST